MLSFLVFSLFGEGYHSTRTKISAERVLKQHQQVLLFNQIPGKRGTGRYKGWFARENLPNFSFGNTLRAKLHMQGHQLQAYYKYVFKTSEICNSLQS